MTLPDASSAPIQTLAFLLPEILLVLVATAMMTAGAVVKWPRRVWSLTALGSVVLALVVLVLSPGQGVDPYASVVSADAFSAYSRLGILLSALILLGLAYDQVDDGRAAEFFGALLFMHAGTMLVASANEMVFLFVGLELVSLPTYLILYLPKRNSVTLEASTKYFYLSVFSSGLLLFGLAYLYGLTGLSNLKALSYLVHWQNGALNLPSPMFATVALVFVMAGLSFRVAAVPLHFYAPDVYQGSPTVLAALLSWIPKAVGFFAVVRVLTALFSFEPTLGGVGHHLAQVSDKAVLLAWVIAVVSMTLGNTVALAQENLKRLLAYSSIAHAGYLMIGVAAAFRNGPLGTEATLGSDAIIFYLAAYALMTLGAFGVIIALDTPERPVENVEDLSGLIYTRPWPAIAMILCLFSLAGIPPMAGFMGKLRIFTAAWEVAREGDTGFFELLLVLGVLNAAIGAYYYLRIIVVMTLGEPRETLNPRAGWPAQLAIGACASLSLLFGVLPYPLSAASRASGVAAVANPEPVLPETADDDEHEVVRIKPAAEAR